MEHDEQELVAALLRSTPPPDVRGDFLARVNARIDAAARPRSGEPAAGWLPLVDFRVWTLRLATAAVALALVALFWRAAPSAAGAPAVESTAAAVTPASTFSPACSSDWQRDVSGDALLDAALSPKGAGDAR